MFYREVYPTLLHKSYRGKYYNADSLPSKYGQVNAADGVEGIELLESYERGEIMIDEDGTFPLCKYVFNIMI